MVVTLNGAKKDNITGVTLSVFRCNQVETDTYRLPNWSKCCKIACWIGLARNFICDFGWSNQDYEYQSEMNDIDPTQKTHCKKKREDLLKLLAKGIDLQEQANILDQGDDIVLFKVFLFCC